MPKGLQVPLGVAKSGGARVQDENTQLDKLIVLALLEGGDDNPFQDLGLSPSILYRSNSDESKFDVPVEVEQKLSSFRGRVKLLGDGVVIKDIVSPENENEYTSVVAFEFVNLDTNDVREFASSVEAISG